MTNTFLEQHQVLFPYSRRKSLRGNTWKQTDLLGDVYFHLMSYWSRIEENSAFPFNKEASFREQLDDHVEGFNELADSYIFSKDALIWLFWDGAMIDTDRGVFTRLRDILVEVNDPNLDSEAYFALLYASYQNEEYAESLKGIPANLLRDMFAPIAVEHLNKWCSAWTESYLNIPGSSKDNAAYQSIQIIRGEDYVPC
jgi:hypothetical protein